jgi:glyoxylase-like metal-dependent hydrolase (beta-lactamase superfamily II)
MASQIPIDDSNRAPESDRDDSTRQIAPDLAYIRALIANVIYYGRPGAGDRGWVLIDAGVGAAKGAIRLAAAERFGRDSRPAAIVLTHGHFDHVGALEELAAEWDAPVYAHHLERPYLVGDASYPDGDPSVGGGLMAMMSRFYPTKPVDVSGRLHLLPEDGTIPFMPGWRWIHTPGHSPGQVSLFRDSDRTLIAGDAVITTKAESAYATLFQSPELHGPPAYFTIDWEKAEESVRKLADLHPRLVITGHGRAMEGPEIAEGLSLLAQDFRAIAVPRKGAYVAHPARVEDGTAYRLD